MLKAQYINLSRFSKDHISDAFLSNVTNSISIVVKWQLSEAKIRSWQKVSLKRPAPLQRGAVQRSGALYNEDEEDKE